MVCLAVDRAEDEASRLQFWSIQHGQKPYELAGACDDAQAASKNVASTHARSLAHPRQVLIAAELLHRVFRAV